MTDNWLEEGIAADALPDRPSQPLPQDSSHFPLVGGDQQQHPQGPSKRSTRRLRNLSDVATPSPLRHLSLSSSLSLTSPPRSSPISSSPSSSGKLGQHVLRGLNVAGAAAAMLTTLFRLFHVDVFLSAYQMPLSTYSTGTLLFALLNTVNDVGCAWLLDHAARTTARSDFVGIAGCLFAVSFLGPFFRGMPGSESYHRYDLWHFVVSLTLYDTFYSFTAILLGSAVADSHFMTDHERVQFMASSKVLNLMASFLVGRIGVSLFRADDLYPFRVFLLGVAMTAALLFVTAQAMMMMGMHGWAQLRRNLVARRWRFWKRDPDLRSSPSPPPRKPIMPPKKDLHWRCVLADFWKHGNFWAWLWVEMLLEAQVTFSSYFLKTFVDSLLYQNGVSRDTCDWLLSVVGPLTQVAAVLAYVPIRQLGYPRMLTILFCFNLIICSLLLLVAHAGSSAWIIVFLLSYPVTTGAVRSSGFHLALSDLVMEMKRSHAVDGRRDEPSVAALFMGANALFCKPTKSLLPIVTATVLDDARDDQDKQEHLFYLLIVPPLICSVLQLLAWRHYDLTPRRTARMREELKSLLQQQARLHHYDETSLLFMNAEDVPNMPVDRNP